MKVWALPLTTAEGASILKAVAGSAARVKVMVVVATSPMPLVACTMIVREPSEAPSAMPLMAPLLLKSRPVGSTPETTLKLGSGKPVAPSLIAKGTPGVPLNAAALVIWGAWFSVRVNAWELASPELVAVNSRL